MGWNLVTSMTDAEAQNHSMDHLPNHDERYKKAEEFAQVMNGLFDSWHTEDFKPNRHHHHTMINRNIKTASPQWQIFSSSWTIDNTK